MNRQFWLQLHATPDFTRAHYASIGIQQVDGALAALDQSMKPLHRLGLSLGLRLHWLIAWQPKAAPGQRMKVMLGFTGPEQSFGLVEKVLTALPFWAAFGATPRPGMAGNLRHEAAPDWSAFKFGQAWHGVQVRKSDRFREPAQFNWWAARDPWAKELGLPSSFQTVRGIEANAESRLITLLRLLPALNEAAVFSVTLQPMDWAARLAEDYAPSLTAFRLFGAERFSQAFGRGRPDAPTEDQMAEEIRKDREETIDLLRDTPHALASIQCWAGSLATAQIMAETVLAEAVATGDCIAVPLAETQPAFLSDAPLPTPSPAGAGRGLDWLPYIYTLEELQGFFRLPALHDGEAIELPKETDPPPARGGEAALVLGERMGLDAHAPPLTVPLSLLAKHALVAGVPGSGKTNTLMSLAHQLRRDHGVPYLILEPAKREYRGLLRIDPDLTVFSPGRVLPGVPRGHAPAFQINPFEIPAGVPLAEHLANLQTAFAGAFYLFDALAALVERAMLSVYRRLGWSLDSISLGTREETRSWPTMSEFVAALSEAAEKTGYAGENMGTLRGAIDTRFKRLLRGESLVGDVFDCDASTLAPESWLTQSAVLELESLGPAYANFLTLILLSLLREVLGAKPNRRLRHLLVLEEAHNLIGPQALAAGGENANPKDAATAYVVKLLAEVRALGQGIVIADQLPSVLAPEVLKNTGLKLCHRLLAQDDRQMMGGTMMASDAKLEAIGLLAPGQALVFHEALQKPIFTQIGLADPQARHLDDLPDDVALAQIMKDQRKRRRASC